MKLLLDENISHRIIKHLSKEFPDSNHVIDISKKRISDLEIWEFARKNDFVIVTYDEDFYEWQLLKNYPPKIVWLRFGNAKNEIIIKKIIENKESIRKLLEDEDQGILEIH